MDTPVPDFVIPSDKDELLQSQPGNYRVKKVFQLRQIQDVLAGTCSILREEGPSFILDHFDKYFSVLVHGSNLDLPVYVQAFEQIHKCLEMFVEQLEKEFERNKEPSPGDKPRLVSIVKMLAYLLCALISLIEATLVSDSAAGLSKRKKNSSKSDVEQQWYEYTDSILVLIYHWVNFPLEKLWQPPIADGSFVMCIADICYRILERCRNTKDKPIRESIFQILGVLVKRYNHSISCVIKIVQLVKMCDGLASHLATGIVQLIEQTQCTGIVKEILREVDRATPEEGGTRNIANFLETISMSKPELILPVIGNLTDHLSNECYLMRNCVIGILGTVVKEVITSEDLPPEQKTKREECLENLMDHMLDTNSFVRSKCLQVWQQLCSEGAVPLANQNALLKATILRLDDKSVLVRKFAFQLLRTLLQCNPFAGKLNNEDLKRQLIDAENRLRIAKWRIASLSKPGAKIRENIWKYLAPTIQSTIADMSVEEYSEKDGEEFSDLDAAFENVRQLLLKDKIREALQLLIRITAKLPGASRLDTMTAEAREEYLISLLLKIFMESQEDGVEIENHRDGQGDTPNEQDIERKKRKEEYDSQAVLVEYIQNCSIFAEELVKAIPIAELRLSSTAATDAIEACSFLGVAYQFRVTGAKGAIRKALYQVFSPDASVCENLAEVYKQLYIGDNADYHSQRQKALAIVKALCRILRNMGPGDSPALTKLITTWRANQVLGPEVLQVMWEKFALKLPDTSPEESRAALMLLTMAATVEPGIITDNFDVLLKVGLGPRAESDLLLARDTCRAMTKVQVDGPDPMKCPSRLPSDHETFKTLLSLLVVKFADTKESGYTSFSTEAINAIYHLANQPDILMKQLLLKLVKNNRPVNRETGTATMASPVLANLLHIVGHIAIRAMVHLDVVVYKEMKRRNTLIEMAKEKRKGNTTNTSISNHGKSIHASETDTPSSASRMLRIRDSSTIEDNGEAALEGATADDADAEFIRHILEHEVINGKGLLAKFVPIVLDVCQHPEKYKEEQLQIAAALALSKMMTVSSVFCRESLQLLITIMERSPYPANRANILVGITDLMNRFPNEVEPWTKHIYGRLRDESPCVRHTCIRMLSNLIMREMIRVKGQVSELAVCLIDPEECIRQEATQFFNELANKGNALYNIMPDILSALTDPELQLNEDKFHHIIQFILGLLQKEKQVDSIIQKVCIRFQLASTERQWRDLAYCLSLLKFNAKSIRGLTENLTLMKDKIHHAPVLKVLQRIIEQAKKKPETKGACIELEEKLEQMLTGNENETEKPNPEAAVMPPPAILPPQRRSKRIRSSSSIA